MTQVQLEVGDEKATMRLDNPTLSELKSATQKLIRRWDADSAVRTMAGIMEQGAKDTGLMFRRLAIIAVEDLGWETLANVHRVMKEIAEYTNTNGLDYEAKKRTLGLIRYMAETDKNLTVPQTHTIAGQWIAPDEWEDALKEAIEEKDLRKLAATATGLRNLKKITPAKQAKLIKSLIDVDSLPEEIKVAYEGLVSRLTKGMMGGDADLFIMALGQIAMGVWDKREFESVDPVDEVPDIGGSITIPWWTIDMHVWWGKIAARTVAKNLDMEYDAFIWVWWFMESRPYDPRARGKEVLATAMERQLMKKTKMTTEQATEWWNNTGRKETKALVEWAADKVRANDRYSGYKRYGN